MNKEELKTYIGQRIIKLRKEEGLKQADLARLTLKDPQHIEKIENGKSNPTIFTLHQIVKGMNKSLSDVFPKDFEG